MLTIIKDKDLIWDTEQYDVILVGTSPYCKLENGFQSKLRYKYPIIEQINDKMPYGDRRRIGTRKTIEETNPIISLCYICFHPTTVRQYIDYNGLENCLATANAEFRKKKVAMPILGASDFDGRGDREQCLDIIKRTMTDVDLYLYDYIQMSKTEEISAQRRRITAMKENLSFDDYTNLKNQLPNILYKLYLGTDPTKPTVNVQKQLEIRNIPKIYVS